MKKRMIALLTLGIIILGLVVAGLYYFALRLPLPEFEVENYEELSDTLKRNPDLLLPDRELLPEIPVYLLVIVNERFLHGKPDGYEIGAPVEDVILRVNCRTIESYVSGGRVLPEFNPNQYIGQKPVQLYSTQYSTSICFRTETCYYNIIVDERSNILAQEQIILMATQMAQNIISKC